MITVQLLKPGLSMYIDRERVVTAEEATNGEDGELENDFKNVQYDADKLVEWPGFNVDIPKGFTDESRYYRFEFPMSDCFVIEIVLPSSLWRKFC